VGASSKEQLPVPSLQLRLYQDKKMPIKKGSKSGKNRKGEAQQKRQGEQEQGEIPPVPSSPDVGPPTIKSEGACGQSSTAEDSEHLEESQYGDSEEGDGADSKQASGGRKMSWREKRKLKKEKKKQDKKDKERKGRKQDEEEQQEQTRSASHSKHSDKRSSQSSQHPPSLSEAPPPQRHHTHSESSQGSHVHANIQDAIVEGGAKQASSEAQGVRNTFACV
jgi:hypothetical protein